MWIINEDNDYVNLHTCDYFGRFNPDYHEGEVDKLDNNKKKILSPEIGIYARYGTKVVPLITMNVIADCDDDSIYTDFLDDALKVIEGFLMEEPHRKCISSGDIERTLIENFPDRGYISWLPSKRKDL